MLAFTCRPYYSRFNLSLSIGNHTRFTHTIDRKTNKKALNATIHDGQSVRSNGIQISVFCCRFGEKKAHFLFIYVTHQNVFHVAQAYFEILIKITHNTKKIIRNRRCLFLIFHILLKACIIGKLVQYCLKYSKNLKILRNIHQVPFDVTCHIFTSINIIFSHFHVETRRNAIFCKQNNKISLSNFIYPN